MNVHIFPPSHIALRLAKDVSPFQLAHELTGSRLTVSNYPAGGFIVHWINQDPARANGHEQPGNSPEAA